MPHDDHFQIERVLGPQRGVPLNGPRTIDGVFRLSVPPPTMRRYQMALERPADFYPKCLSRSWIVSRFPDKLGYWKLINGFQPRRLSASAVDQPRDCPLSRHGTVDAAATSIVSGPIQTRLGKTHTDFGPGFYTTTLLRQAHIWAAQIAATKPRSCPPSWSCASHAMIWQPCRAWRS